MSAAEVVRDALAKQGAQYPNAGGLLILSALKHAGYAVVELPKPDDDGSWRVGGTDLEVRLAHYDAEGNEIQIRFNSVRGYGRTSKGYEPTVGPDLAAALLAAADASEAS